MTKSEFVLGKVLSGKFLFTIIAAIVFAVLSLKGALPQDKVMEVVLIVIYAYFNRPKQPDRKAGEDGDSK